MNIEAKTKQWGNSIGIIIPSSAVEKLNIKADETINLDINKKGNVLREMFGRAKTDKNSKEIIEKTRKDLESKWLK